MASRKNVDFVMRARDDTRRGVRSVQRRFRGLGRSVGGVFGRAFARGGALGLALGLVAKAAAATSKAIDEKLTAAYDDQAEALQRLEGATADQIQGYRTLRRVGAATGQFFSDLGDSIAGFIGTGVNLATRTANILRSVTGPAEDAAEATDKLAGSQEKLNNKVQFYNLLADLTIKNIDAQLERELKLKEAQEARQELARDFYDFILDSLDKVIEREKELDEQRRRAQIGVGNEDLRASNVALSSQGRAAPPSRAERLRDQIVQREQLQALKDLRSIASNPTVGRFAEFSD